VNIGAHREISDHEKSLKGKKAEGEEHSEKKHV